MIQNTPTTPCPTHVVINGCKEYCEQGYAGHQGTCIGSKPEWQYRAELKAWREQHSTINDPKDTA